MGEKGANPNTHLRLLFVEDNPVDAELALKQLENGGFEVMVDIVQTADDFRSKLASAHYDVVLSDLGLPNWSGLDALEIVKEMTQDIPFIVVTGTVGEEAVSECLKLGATDYVLKDRPTRLPAAIRRALQEKSLREEGHRAQEQILRLAAIVDSSDDAILGTTLDGTITNWNAGAERLYGYGAGEAIGRPAAILAPAERSGEISRALQQIRHGERVHNFETAGLGKDGRLVDISMTVSPIRDSTGKVAGVSVIAHDVTERKRAEGELRASETRYRRLFEAAQDGILILDAESAEIRDVNPFLTDLLEFSKAELLGKKLWEIGPFRDVISSQEGFKELQKNGFIRYDDLPLKTRSGKQIAVEFVSNVYLAGDRKVIQCNIRDITEHKRAGETLRESDERFRATFQNAGVGMALVDLQGRPIRSNPALRQMLGYSEEELSQMVFTEFTHPDDRESDWGLYCELTAGKREKYEIEKRFLKKGGQVVWGLLTVSLMKDTRGCPVCAVAMVQDVSERKRTEAESVRLMTAIEQAAEGMVVTGAEGNIQYVNPAFTAMTGYSREEVLGQNPRLLKSGKHDAAFYASLWATIVAGQVWRGEMINRRKDGSLYTERMSITPIRNGDGQMTHIVAMKEDITAQKLLEDQFRQAQKMEAVGRLAAGVAHDFNNLLTIIIGYSELMLDQLASGDPMRNNMDQIKGAGEKAAGLTRQLLAFSRQQVLAPQSLDLNTLIANLTRLLNRLIGEDIELVFNPGSSAATVKVDPGLMEQVLMNLAVNSRDAMPRGGILTIETFSIQVDEAYRSTHFTMTVGPYVALVVSDTGCGMDEATQAHIFEPFFTTKEVGKGTGLGLATVYGIVKQSGGHIGVHSELGTGTTFEIYLPAVTGVPQPATVGAVAAGGTETVLLVEDDANLRELARMVLVAKGGYKVLESIGGEEARLFAGEYQGPIHLLLTDVVMPGMGGRELSEELATLRPDMKILFMSGYTDDTVVRHGVFQEGTAFLQKPFTSDALLRKVRDVLDAGPPT